MAIICVNTDMRISTSTGRSCRNAVKVFCGKIKISTDYKAYNTVCRLQRYTVLMPAQYFCVFEAIFQSNKGTSVMRKVNVRHEIKHYGRQSPEG